MDRTSKLAEIKLVTKHCSHANFSYPRRDDGSFANTIRTVNDRTSLGSESSAPGLIDDRSDSEYSQDDDSQYHAETSEIWDSFWQHGQRVHALPVEVEEEKPYPALIPTHHSRERSQDSYEERVPSWPLRDTRPSSRMRKPAASYSAFPSVRPHSIQKRLSVAKKDGIPIRPPRPTDLLLTPCLQQVTNTVTSPTLMHVGGAFPTVAHRPTTSSGEQMRATKSLDGRPHDLPNLARRASMVLTRRPSLHALKVRTPRHTKSISNIVFSPADVEPVPPTPTLTELQSFFDYDDSDGEDDHRGFRLRFHKRGSSEVKPAEKPKRRNRAETLPSSPVTEVASHGKPKRQADVLGRMLGRRSRQN